MATVTDGEGRGLQLLVEWDRGSGVSSPELSETWCRLEIRVDGRPVSLVEDTRTGGIRRGIHTSAYPLAEWIATRWWPLQVGLRPSAISATARSWRHNKQESWLTDHNMRGAGNGMPWPDLTLVPEGSVSRLSWFAGGGLDSQPINFLSSGDLYTSAEGVRSVLARFVEQVLERLSEAQVTGTLLQQEWRALAALDEEEQQFASSAARLGLDPFNVDAAVADQITGLAAELDPRLLEEFLDSADPSSLADAAGWLQRAQDVISRSPMRALERLDAYAAGADRPWERGYELARAFRAKLGISPTATLELDSFVGVSRVGGEPAGLHGLVMASDAGVGLALPDSRISETAARFAQARALGIAVATNRLKTLLDPTRSDSSKQSRAFAAELIAPAEGIAEYLSVFPIISDRAIEAVADRYKASPMLVQRQHENQLS